MHLLAHGEGAGQGDLGGLAGVGAQELHVAHLDRPRAADLADDPRHHGLLAAIVDDLGRVLVVDAVQRRREVVGVALAPHLAVGDDVDAGPLHVADGEQGGVVLRLLQVRVLHAPQLVQPRARHAFHQQRAIDQPVGLRVGADDGGLQQGVGHVTAP